MCGILGMAGFAEAVEYASMALVGVAAVGTVFGLAGIVFGLIWPRIERGFLVFLGGVAVLAALAVVGLSVLLDREGVIDMAYAAAFIAGCAGTPLLLGLAGILLARRRRKP